MLKLRLLDRPSFGGVQGITHNSYPSGHATIGMVLSLGFRSGVPWNESGFASKDFDAALDAAEALIDVEQRRAAMEKVEKILQDAAVTVQPVWPPKFFSASDKVQGMTAHPTQYHQYHRVWLKAGRAVLSAWTAGAVLTARVVWFYRRLGMAAARVMMRS